MVSKPIYIEKKSPAPLAHNVNFEDPHISVTFSGPYVRTSVNERTFQVAYLGVDDELVYVDGKFEDDEDTNTVTFVPKQKLKDGVRYAVKVWGENDAKDADRDQWVRGANGFPLEEGSKDWTFWTMPNLQVSLVPVQVVEGSTLIAQKATVLRTFVRWDLKPDVAPETQLKKVDIDDVKISWVGPDNSTDSPFSWKADTAGQWDPPWDPLETTTRRQEYRVQSPDDLSWSKAEKMRGVDSVNFFGFTPGAPGRHIVNSLVQIEDDRGRIKGFSAQVSEDVVERRDLRVRIFPVAVGAWYSMPVTSTMDLSRQISYAVKALESVYPTALVIPSFTNYPTSLPLYRPLHRLVEIPGYTWDWSRAVAEDDEKLELLERLSTLCRFGGCDLAAGIVPGQWLHDMGLTNPEDRNLHIDVARYGTLVQETSMDNNRFVLSHELGHIAIDQDGDDWDDEDPPVPAGEGYDVRARQDKRYSVSQWWPPVGLMGVWNFMIRDPIDDTTTGNILWISKAHYDQLIREYLLPGDGTALQSIDPVLFAGGVILTATNAVTLTPWYQLSAGTWRTPEPGPYTISFLDNNGSEITGYSRSFGAAPDVNPSRPARFLLKIPYPANAKKTQIKLGSTVLKEVVASANAPTLNIIAPTAGDTWNGARSITWTASDPDGGALHYAVEVSADNGSTWQALAIDLTASPFNWQTTGITSTNQALVRVSATDGFRTTIRTAGPFTVTNAPTVTLVFPAVITGASTTSPIVLRFTDDMDPSSITSATVSVAGGPFGRIAGTVTYSREDAEATFQPVSPLAFSTNYTVTVSAGARSRMGLPLPRAASWSFRTQADPIPPQPVAYSPVSEAFDVPLNAEVAVVWNEDLKPSTMTGISFTLATTNGVPLAGAVSYDAGARTAKFKPTANLKANTTYTATLKAGIQDAAGNPTQRAYQWFFKTGERTVSTTAFTGSFLEQPVDDNGDGLYDRLVIKVGVQVTATGSYSLTGSLVDANGEKIAQVSGGAFLQLGTRFVGLTFSGGSIGGHGVDGPFTLTGLLFYKADDYRISARRDDAYRTAAYPASRFYSRLTFTGLPDINLRPGTSRDYAFNVRDYARHVSLGSNQLTYSITMYTAGEAGVTLGSDGYVNIHPWSEWTGSSRITVQASAGNDITQDTFEVNVGWQYRVSLPVVLKGYDGSSSSLARSNWKTPLFDDFESGSTGGWARWSMKWNLPGDTINWFTWGVTDCVAYSGRYSSWPFGGDVLGIDPDGSSLSCAADYPNGYTGYIANRPTINLEYVGAAEFRMKVRTNLDQGDSICAMVSTDLGDIQDKSYYGVCKTGQTQGWEDLVLDLSNVPTLGNLLGRDQVWVAVKFDTNNAGTKPNGAFVDDVTLRLCPAGLTCR